MKAELRVSIKLAPYSQPIEVCKTIDGPYEMGFAPVDHCDDPLVAVAVGGTLPADARIVAKKRHDYAKFMAGVIANEIYKLMESRDTINGYPIEEPK